MKHLGLGAAEAKKIRYYRSKMYRTFDIRKKSGKARVINAPDRRLKILQRKICDLITPLYRRRNPVHGFVADRSVKTNAQSHLGGKFIVNLDLKDFFPSISERRIVGVLMALGLKRDVAERLSSICCVDNGLPQGAPSSPILSNMICFRMDKQLMAFAKSARCIYTRYADDITFSSYRPLTGLFESVPPPSGSFPPELLSSELLGIFGSNGFTIHPDKAHYADRNSRRTVTGLRVNENLNVDRRFVRNLRAALYSVEKLGEKPAETKFHADHGGRAPIGRHLQGKLAWLGHIKGPADPVFRSIASRFNAAFPSLALKILPTQLEIRERTVWLIEHWEGTGAQGTAFFLTGVGLVTADHCVSPSGAVEMYHPSKPSNRFAAMAKHRSSDRDLAVLDHAIPPNEFYELDASNVGSVTGDATVAIGYPGFGPGDKVNVRSGNVTSLPTKSGIQKIEVQQTLTPGMSGGPLLNSIGQVIGVIHKGGAEEERQLAIDISVLQKWVP
ncbi:reverse transcriptase domain-containing protein [Sphingomonas sp. CFBP 8760]|uniref:reverse transcriptase domain-containing protein n=1 Tax=Sphingomonas sp. CFBP 8760 TaxID=2775282 RepID=UPI00177D64D6|nr:reverse transcriptase domain-containing protein [Sphingomonas sp. CFBP 8760]MBD8546030.1 trypsin-like peptidase domain-containing protein [Sphingomonas sp. CFBP 8760]